ncbi:MAG: hypothetical protein ACOCP4_05820, partial [Candidatus Woesearchaeota archaeon]
AEAVNPDPLSSDNDGVIARGESGDPHGTGADSRLILELDPISGTDNSGTYSAYQVRIPEDGVPAQLQGHTNPFTGSEFEPGDRVGNIVPMTFGFNVRPRLYDDDTEIPISHASDWYLDAYAGVVTQEEDEPSKMVDYGTTGKLHCYVYIGTYVSEKLSGLGSGTTYQFYENQTIGNGITGDVDGSNKDFVLDNEPITNSQMVYLNGMLQEEGQDYTITGDTITFMEAPEVVTVDGTDYPDKIVVSYRTNT